MDINELLKYRSSLLDESKDENECISDSSFLKVVLPSMLEVKLVDSDDFNEAYYVNSAEKIKINGYTANESGERLQLYLVNEDSINISASEDDLKISHKLYYENQFSRVTKFVTKAFKGHLSDQLQDSSPVKAIVSYLSSVDGAEQFDVIEVFLISATVTISLKGLTPETKRIEFEDEKLKIVYTRSNKKHTKELIITKRLVDINLLYNVLVSQGNREALLIDFEQTFGYKLEAIRAADEVNFESYLCVFPGQVLANLYKRYSSRLLEKNVRSFLQFRGVNQGMKDTIRREPEKFLAYNNGLTITATGKEVTYEDGKVHIKSLFNFQIVNGGQTTAAIYFSQKEGLDISKLRVIAKINVVKESTDDELDNLISKISTYSNAQSRVSTVDLRSRNSQLVKLKSLSESIVTPSGLKWFFERAKGEFNTLLRIAGSSINKIKKEFPNDRRFSKEQLAKYYSAWGDQPYMIKKGGEKVFRYFIEQISGEGKNKKIANIDRRFYEDLISRIILFRKSESVYGQGDKSMGQLRSAVIPYSISILYHYSLNYKKGHIFNLSKIWAKEGLGENLEEFMKNLMLLMNDLIKVYSKSDDYGEYSKKPELWESIKNSEEIREFISSANSVKIMNEFCIPLDNSSKTNKTNWIDFSFLVNSVRIYRNTSDFYRSLRSMLHGTLKTGESNRLSSIILKIENHEDFNETELQFEAELINKLRTESPHLFDLIQVKSDSSLSKTLDFIIQEYNTAVAQSIRLDDHFNNIAFLAEARKAIYCSSYREIGKLLMSNNLPTIKLINSASDYVSRVKAGSI